MKFHAVEWLPFPLEYPSKGEAVRGRKEQCGLINCTFFIEKAPELHGFRVYAFFFGSGDVPRAMELDKDWKKEEHVSDLFCCSKSFPNQAKKSNIRDAFFGLFKNPQRADLTRPQQ